MLRTPFSRSLARAGEAARLANQHSLSAEDSLAWLGTRRGLLGGLGAAGAGLALPGRAWAARATSPGRVAIVGAGLGGLACAWELKKAGVTARVLEAGSRVGGRTWSMGAGWAGTVDFQGQVIEAGGELIDTTHRTMRGYCQDFGLELEAYDQEPGDMFYHFQGQSWTEAEVVEELRALIPAMRRDLHRSSGAPTALSFTEADEELDNTDLATWLDSRGAGPLIRAAIEAAYIGEYGRELHEQTCLNLLLFMHPDRRSRFQPFGLWSDERYHVRQGSQAVARELAARLDGQIELDARLVALDRSPSGTYRLTFDDGQGSWEEQADRVVVALPFTVLREVDLGPGLELPAWKRVLIENYKLGHNSKMMIGFNGRPWQALGNDGATLSDLASTHNTWETNPSAATASRGVLTNYLGGDRALAVVGSAAEVQAAVADLQLLLPGIGAQLSTVSGLPRYHTQSWAPNPLSRGSYTCGGPGFFTTQAGLEAIPVGGLYFAGEHTDSFYNWQGYMEGAACSGVAAAAALLAG